MRGLSSVRPETKKGPDGDSSATGPSENQPTHEQESRMHIVAHTTDADGQVSGMNDTPDLFAYLAEEERQQAEQTGAATRPQVDRDEDQALTLAQKFVRFHKDNPHLLDELERRAADWHRATGGDRTAVDMFLYSLRFDWGIRTKSDDWKINNSHSAFYVRLLVHRHPEWADMFEMRKSIADEDRSWLDEVAA